MQALHRWFSVSVIFLFIVASGVLAANLIGCEEAVVTITDTDGDGTADDTDTDDDGDGVDDDTDTDDDGDGTADDDATDDDDTPAPSFSLTSTDLTEGGTFASTFVDSMPCTGENQSPQLSWANPPSGVASYALVMEDLSVDDGAGGPMIHWLIYDIPTTTTSIARNGATPTGAKLVQNTLMVTGYSGPCPGGETHTYRIKVWAMNTADLNTTAGLTNPTAKQVYNALDTYDLGSVILTATSNAALAP